MEDNEKKGIEVIAIWESLIESNGTFYSDSNGIELLERKWVDGMDGMDIPANYYPVTSMIGVKDNKTAMFVLNDRAQGGSSIKPGRVELAINRKTVGADQGGMLIGLDIYGKVETEFQLHFEWKKSTEEKLIDIKDLFAKLLRKSSLI